MDKIRAVIRATETLTSNIDNSEQISANLNGEQQINGTINNSGSLNTQLSGTPHISAVLGGPGPGPIGNYYTKPEIDAFREQDRDYVNAQDLILQTNIDKSGHRIFASISGENLTISLLDKNNNVISITSVEIDDRDIYITSGEYDAENEVIIFRYNNGITFDVSVSSLVSGLETLIEIEENRAKGVENLLSERISSIEEDYLTSSDKNDLEGQISNVQDNLDIEVTNRENADNALDARIDAIESASYITQDINTSSITVQYTKSTSKTILSASSTWTQIQGITNKMLLSSAYGNEYYIVVGEDGTVIYSKDGINWSIRDTKFTDYDINKICFGNGYFLALSFEQNQIFQSYEPNIWNRYSSISNVVPTNLIYTNNKFFITTENGKLLMSEDGRIFKTVSLPINETINSIAYGNSVYVAVGNNGTVLYSKNAQTWYNRTDNTFNENYYDIIFYNGKFIAYSDNYIRYSTNYYQFNTATIPTLDGYIIQSIVNGEGSFYAISSNGIYSKILKSNDGITYENVYDTNSMLVTMCFGEDTYIATGEGRYIYNLNLQINWSFTKPSLEENEYLWGRSVNYLNNGDILYSAAYFIFTPKTLSEFQNDMGYINNEADNLVNYYNIPTTNDLLDAKQDDMVDITNNEINGLFN